MSHAKVVSFALTVLVAIAAPVSALADDLIVVWLNDGRMLVGGVDPRTDNERLWLQTTGTSFVVSTSADWDNINAVNANGERMSPDTFAKRVDEFSTDAPAPPVATNTNNVTSNVTTHVPRPLLRRNEATRVASLEVEGRVANWDRDAETDGIEIRVIPRNAFGEAIAASGQITATLIARNQLPTHDPNAFPQLGRWSLNADTSDFGSHGAVYRLPFRGKHPDREFSLEPHGLVEVSFYAHGYGRFTSDVPVYLYKFNPVRRDMQRGSTGRNR